MDKQQIINHWLISAERDIKTVEVLFNNKKYDHALFFAHLSLEKVIKSVFIKRKNESDPPFIHDLVRLSVYADIVLNEQQKDDLREINTFNIKARYDDLKLELYKKATEEYTQNWINKVKEYILWFQRL